MKGLIGGLAVCVCVLFVLTPGLDANTECQSLSQQTLVKHRHQKPDRIEPCSGRKRK